MINDQIEQLAQMCEREFARLHERFDAVALKEDLQVLRVEMNETFQSVLDRLEVLERAAATP